MLLLYSFLCVMNYTDILARFKIESLNEMQQAAMKAIPQPGDTMLISPTGSGKTLAYLLPSLQLLDMDASGVQLMIIVPSRELALQIEQVFKQMSTGYKINCCYGGHSVRIEKNNLSHPPTVLVGTPGRIAYHLRNDNVSAVSAHTLVLDEFDKSLELGFQEDMAYIISRMPGLRKRILTSATQLAEIPPFVKARNVSALDFSTQREELKSRLNIMAVNIPEGMDKVEGLMLLIGAIGSGSKIVFCNHRDAVRRISQQLDRLSMPHGIYHGELDQVEREKALIKLRNGSTTLLITTDLAARGLDIPEIDSVIHYQLPHTPDTMTHRNGRTARMDASGTAYLLLESKDYIPPFLDEKPEEFLLPDHFTKPTPSQWQTLYIAAGKKDKINRTDIVGMLLQKGGLQKDELGKIEVLDNAAYAAIKSDKIRKTLSLIANEKIKNKKMKFEISS